MVKIRKVSVGRYAQTLSGIFSVVLLSVTTALHFTHKGSLLEFVFGLITIIPVSAIVRLATKDITLTLQNKDYELLAGVFNGLFGYPPKTLATIKGKPAVAQTTLTGSIISNCLTTFGTCLLLGGIAHHRQSYPVVIARTNAQLLVVSLVSITLPTAFQTWSEGSLAEDHVGPPSISYGSAIVLLLEFASYILFFYYTHRRMDEKEPRLQDGLICASFLPVLMTRVEYENLKVKESFKTLRELRLAAREDAAAAAPEDEAPAGAKPAYVAISILVVGFTAQVFTSIFVVEAIESPSHTLGLSKSFVGLIVMPMVISSVEYITAAIRSRREGIAWIIEVAFGSSIRITLFVFPLAVLIGWMAGVSGMTMIFDGFQVTMLALTILLVNHVLQNGFLHWIEGTLFISSFLLFAIAVWHYPNDA